MAEVSNPQSQPTLQIEGLRRSARMPVLFIGHGSPMNAIEDNPFRRSWEALGQRFGKDWPMPQLILCVSAHWLTDGWWLTAMAKPKTIHDFGGFPPALFAQQYPAPGAPELARLIAAQVRQPVSGSALGLDQTVWGLDHGCWSVLKPMFPKADIAVLQLGMDYGRSMQEHLAVGQQLAALRELGVLIVASGNIVHNLRAMSDGPPEPYAIEFDSRVATMIEAGDTQGLAGFQQWGAMARAAHPSIEHFLPLFYAMGATRSGDRPKFFNDQFQLGSISMRSVVWD
jgi:4,5-DOPA dioxygenase extradiol